MREATGDYLASADLKDFRVLKVRQDPRGRRERDGGKLEQRADGWHLVIDTTEDDLQRAKAFEPGK